LANNFETVHLHDEGKVPMTLDIRAVSPIGGESAIRIREILRRAHGAFRQDWLSDTFQYSRQKACGIAIAMVGAGILERDRGREERYRSPMPWYTVTDAGRALARASAAPRISRKTAETALHEFINRVHAVNGDSRYLYSVRKAVVFGSFLVAREDLGDVDVAVDLQSRIRLDDKDKWVEIFREHALNSGRSFSTFEEEIDWPRREVALVLKSRKRSISLQPWYSFVEMGKNPNFRFEILVGDPEEISREVVVAGE
jgi:hypothetical protein